MNHIQPSQKSSRRRVLHVVPSLNLGGTEKTAQLFAIHLNKNFFDVAVWSPSNGPRFLFLQQAGIPTWINIPLEKILYTFKPHIVHIHRAGWPEPKLMRNFRGTEWYYKDIKLPKIIETNVFGRFDSSYSGRIIDKTLFVSKFCAWRFAQMHNVVIPSKRYDIIYNPVDVAFITNNTIPPEKKVFSKPVIGRLSRADKGKWSLHFGLEMFPYLLSQLPDVHYYIVGGIQEAYDFVNKNNLSNNITFLPEIIDEQNLTNYLNMLSVFVHANDTGESFGLSIAEAMAAGLPVVTHPTSGLKDNAQIELVEHGITGFVANTPEEYAHAILTILKNPTLAKKMGIASQKKAWEFFNASIVTQQLEHNYNKLCPTSFVKTNP